MKFLAFFLLPALATAQYGAPPPPIDASSTSSAAAAFPTAPPNTPGVINVDVAFNETFVYNPANFTADVGTVVNFYIPNNGLAHSVTQSNFTNPCTHLAASGNSSGGFDSGLQTARIFSINIADTQPIWFHCKQVQHCGMGMVGSINAPTSGNNTYELFKAAAVAIGLSETTETDAGPVTGGVHGVATAPPTSATAVGSSGSSGSSASSGSASGGIRVTAGSTLVLIMTALTVFFA